MIDLLEGEELVLMREMDQYVKAAHLKLKQENPCYQKYYASYEGAYRTLIENIFKLPSSISQEVIQYIRNARAVNIYTAYTFFMNGLLFSLAAPELCIRAEPYQTKLINDIYEPSQTIEKEEGYQKLFQEIFHSYLNFCRNMEQLDSVYALLAERADADSLYQLKYGKQLKNGLHEQIEQYVLCFGDFWLYADAACFLEGLLTPLRPAQSLHKTILQLAQRIAYTASQSHNSSLSLHD